MQSRVAFPNKLLPYLLVAPQIAITLVFFFWPASQALYQSLLREDPFGLASTFVGLGVNPPGASWGVMLSLAFNKVTEHPWMVFVPGLAIGLTVLAINIVGDSLRDALGRVED